MRYSVLPPAAINVSINTHRYGVAVWVGWQILEVLKSGTWLSLWPVTQLISSFADYRWMQHYSIRVLLLSCVAEAFHFAPTSGFVTSRRARTIFHPYATAQAKDCHLGKQGESTTSTSLQMCVFLLCCPTLHFIVIKKPSSSPELMSYVWPL